MPLDIPREYVFHTSLLLHRQIIGYRRYILPGALAISPGIGAGGVTFSSMGFSAGCRECPAHFHAIAARADIT